MTMPPSNELRTQADLLTQQGVNALRSGDSASARDLLTRAVNLDPTNVRAWL
jgi:Flp pilus assembly protein TadD